MTERKKLRTVTMVAAVLAFVAARRSTLLDALGALLVVIGVGLWSVPVALVVAGAAVLLIAHPIPIRYSR